MEKLKNIVEKELQNTKDDLNRLANFFVGTSIQMKRLKELENKLEVLESIHTILVGYEINKEVK